MEECSTYLKVVVNVREGDEATNSLKIWVGELSGIPAVYPDESSGHSIVDTSIHLLKPSCLLPSWELTYPLPRHF